MDKENILYYQSNIKTSRNEDSVYAMKYASQQMLIDKLEQQCKKQKEVINNIIEYIKENMYSYYDNNGEKCIEETVFERSVNPKELLDILKEVSE